MMAARGLCTSPDHVRSDLGSARTVSCGVERWLGVGLAAAGVLILSGWAFLAVVHADDRYHVGWVEGTHTALARFAAGGDLFPALYDGHVYGGTRFMPGPIVLHAGLALLTGEYLVSGKLIAYLSTVLL